MKIMKKALSYLYIFYVIYTPAFGGGIVFDRYFTLYLLAAIMLVPYVIKKDRSIINLLMQRRIIYFMLAILITSVYLTIVQIMNNVDITNIADLRLVQNNIINILLIHAAIIVDKLKKAGFSKNQSFELLLRLGALQGLIAMLEIAIPEIKALSTFLYEAAGGSNGFVIAARIYGVSSDYTFGTPIYHGLLSGLSLYKAISERNKKYYLYLIPLMLATFVNGRTGIIIFLLVSMLSILHTYIRRGEKGKILSATAMIIIIVLSTMNVLGEVSPNSHKFINSFIEDTKNLVINHQLSGNYEVLINDSLRLPVANKLIFGSGHRVYEYSAENPDFRSDIGYVNDIYIGGLIFITFFYGMIIYFITYKKDKEMFLNVLILLTLVVANCKGEIFRSSIFMFLVVYMKMLDISYKNNRITELKI